MTAQNAAAPAHRNGGERRDPVEQLGGELKRSNGATKLKPQQGHAACANAAHGLVKSAGRQVVESAIDAGNHLQAAKAIVGYGAWLGWLKNNCPDISERTAQAYMRLARANPQRAADLSLRQALKAISPPKEEWTTPKRKRVTATAVAVSAAAPASTPVVVTTVPADRPATDSATTVARTDAPDRTDDGTGIPRFLSHIERTAQLIVKLHHEASALDDKQRRAAEVRAMELLGFFASSQLSVNLWLNEAVQCVPDVGHANADNR